MINVENVADRADMIVGGYAFTKDGTNIRILNLHKPDHATLFDPNQGVLETTMDDIENEIVQEYIKDNYCEMYLKWSQMSNQGFYGDD